jgi:putative acetyltransferase
MEIRLDDLRGPEIMELLRAHLENSRLWSPPESIHALALEGLRAPDVTFWTAWEGTGLLGCGALRELDARHGEVKSMHTAAEHRRRGVAARLLSHILHEARSRSYQRISLETGSMNGFAPARALYSRFGFIFCDPFGEYKRDPNSVFMTLDLSKWNAQDANEISR